MAIEQPRERKKGRKKERAVRPNLIFAAAAAPPPLDAAARLKDQPATAGRGRLSRPFHGTGMRMGSVFILDNGTLHERSEVVKDFTPNVPCADNQLL